MIKKLVNRLGLPLVVALALVMSFATAVGAVPALYEVWRAHAIVTILEPIVVTVPSETDGWIGSPSNQWTVSMYPGDTVTLPLSITNNSPVTIEGVLTTEGDITGLTIASVPALMSFVPGVTVIDLSVTASSSTPPGLKTFNIVVLR